MSLASVLVGLVGVVLIAWLSITIAMAVGALVKRLVRK